MSTRPWAPEHADAVETVAALRSTGWHAALVDPSASLEHAWTLLAEGSR
nr:hypothetical protein [Cellulosimicrobium sp. MM]